MTTRDRIESLDVLRGVAICGILLMTICHMGSVRPIAVDHFPPRLDLQWSLWAVQDVLVNGTMRGLFTMLFGASMLLMLRRAESHGAIAPVDQWVRRALALIAIGLFLAFGLQWPGEILTTYGISALFLLSLRVARPAVLAAVAAVLLSGLALNDGYRTYQSAAQMEQAATAATLVAQGSPIDADQADALAAARAEHARARPSEAAVAAAVDARRHPLSLLRWSERAWLSQNIGGTGWTNVAESVAFMAIGMALLRLRVLTGAAPMRLYWGMAAAGYAGGLAWRALDVWRGVRTALDASSVVVSPVQQMLIDAAFQPARLLVTLGHVGLVLALFKAGWFGRAVHLRAMGRMALSVYALQAAAGSLLFYALGLLGRFELPGLWLIAACFWIGSALLCRWWLSRHAAGPAEALLRAASRGGWTNAATDAAHVGRQPAGR